MSAIFTKTKRWLLQAKGQKRPWRKEPEKQRKAAREAEKSSQSWTEKHVACSFYSWRGHVGSVYIPGVPSGIFCPVWERMPSLQQSGLQQPTTQSSLNLSKEKKEKEKKKRKKTLHTVHPQTTNTHKIKNLCRSSKLCNTSLFKPSEISFPYLRWVWGCLQTTAASSRLHTQKWKHLCMPDIYCEKRMQLPRHNCSVYRPVSPYNLITARSAFQIYFYELTSYKTNNSCVDLWVMYTAQTE